MLSRQTKIRVILLQCIVYTSDVGVQVAALLALAQLLQALLLLLLLMLRRMFLFLNKDNTIIHVLYNVMFYGWLPLVCKCKDKLG